MNRDRPLRVCYVLAYRAPDYIRTQSILTALRQMPGVELRTAINTSTGSKRYIETLKAASVIAKENWADVYILGFRGHELYWPLRMIAGRKPIIFDAMMSPFAALREESKHGLPGIMASGIVHLIEKLILQDSHTVLTDTELHARYFSKEFGIPEKKITAIPVGAIENGKKGNTFGLMEKKEVSLLFYGSFLPLHGVDIIIAAARLLTDLSIRFDFVGGGQDAAETLARSFPSSDTLHYTHREWVPFDELIQSTIPQADICLGGPFGNTVQARRVVTGKTSQCLAAGKPTIIGRIDEDYGFIDKENCLLVDQGSPESLAAAIRWAVKHQNRLDDIGTKGAETYWHSLSIAAIQKKLEKILGDLRSST